MRLLALLLVALPVWAQAPPPVAEVPEGMKRLAPWVGTWSGEGWMRFGPGEPEKFRSVETVETRLGGHVLVIEGRHHKIGSDALVHHAFGVVSLDAASGSYRFRSHLANGRSGDYAAEWKDGAFQWVLEIPGRGKQRFTIRISGQTWDETGEMERNGNWVPFFGMHLKRQ